MLYDQCIASFDCLPWRNTPYVKHPNGLEEGYYSVHYTCMPGGSVEKPGRFEDDNAFWSEVSGAKEAYKYFYTIWYEKFERAFGGPLGGREGLRYPGERPTYNATWVFNPPKHIFFDRR